MFIKTLSKFNFRVSPPLAQLQHTGNLEFGLNDGALCKRGVWSACTRAWLTLLRHSSWLWLVVSDGSVVFLQMAIGPLGGARGYFVFFLFFSQIICLGLLSGHNDSFNKYAKKNNNNKLLTKVD